MGVPNGELSIAACTIKQKVRLVLMAVDGDEFDKRMKGDA